MHLIKIEFFHNQHRSKKDPLNKCSELYLKIDKKKWMPMRVCIGDEIEEYLEKNIHIDNN